MRKTVIRSVERAKTRVSLHFLSYDLLFNIYSADGKEMCMNIYDVRLDDTYPACGMNWPPDIKPVTNYLDVRLC